MYTINNSIKIEVYDRGIFTNMCLEIGLSLFGGTIGTGTYKCFRNSIAYSIFKEIRLRQGQTTHKTYTPEQMGLY